jgi:hypothetical protein
MRVSCARPTSRRSVSLCVMELYADATAAASALRSSAAELAQARQRVGALDAALAAAAAAAAAAQAAHAEASSRAAVCAGGACVCVCVSVCVFASGIACHTPRQAETEQARVKLLSEFAARESASHAAAAAAQDAHRVRAVHAVRLLWRCCERALQRGTRRSWARLKSAARLLLSVRSCVTRASRVCVQ